MIIKIERYYKYPDLKRQTPNCSMMWKDLVFTEEPVSECDYLVVLDYPKEDFSIKVNKKNVLHLSLEPPNEVSKYRQYANKKSSLIYNQLETKIKNDTVLSHGALPWHIDKDYDFLNNLELHELNKENKIVWITSNQRSSRGHKKRMDFLGNIRKLPFVELYGRGINPIDDKWEVLKNAKYAIAYENFKNDYYWTEKIIDCYLSYTMPIYYGCNSIENFFPKNSFIQLDPNDRHIHLFLKEMVHSNLWEENIDAIIKARDLVLNEYQLFPFLYNQIRAIEAVKGGFTSSKKELICFKGKDAYFDNYPLSVSIEKKLIKFLRRLNKRFNNTI